VVITNKRIGIADVTDSQNTNFSKAPSYPKLKLNDLAVEEIHIELREGLPCRVIAEQFGVSTSLVQMMREGRVNRIPGYIYPVLKSPSNHT